MRYAVGYVQEVSGQVVKKIFSGVDVELKQGDFVMLDDHIWSRSLDSYAKILLHGGGVLEMRPGMRIAIDNDYLRVNEIHDFFTQEEIENLKDSLPYTLDTSSFEEENSVDDIKDKINASVVIYNKTLNDPIVPTLENSLNIYKSGYGEIYILIKSNPGNSVELYGKNSSNPIGQSQISTSGSALFSMVDDKEKSRLDLCVKVFDPGTRAQIFSYDMSILIDKSMSKERVDGLFVKPTFEDTHKKTQEEEKPKQQAQQQKNTNFDITLADGYHDSIGSMFESTTFDVSNMRMIKGDSISVKKRIYSNIKNPVFKFGIDSNIIPKIFIIGYDESIFEERLELKSHINYTNGECYVVSDTKFETPGEYMFYVRFMNKLAGNVLKEEFFSYAVKFINLSAPKKDKIENGKFYGYGADANSNLTLFAMVEDESYKELGKIKSDHSGKFTFDVQSLPSGKYALMPVDLYSNVGKPAYFEI